LQPNTHLYYLYIFYHISPTYFSVIYTYFRDNIYK